MEPRDEEALRNLPEKELLIQTAIVVHDLAENLRPRVAKLEKWQDHAHWVGGTIAALFGAGMLNLHALLHHAADKFGGRAP